jgi:hypothetical protein
MKLKEFNRPQLFVRGKCVRLFTVFVSGIEARLFSVLARSRDYCMCSGCLHVHVQQYRRKKETEMKSAL